GAAQSRRRASAIGAEVEALYTNGPAGGGGARTFVRESLSVKSCSLPLALTKVSVIHADELVDHEEMSDDREA
ncbi:hypothetical protein R0J89_15845, partial [Psychrobacter sp. SIMBA_152]